MGIALTIARKDIREVFRNKSTYIYVAFLFVIAFPYVDGLRSSLSRLTAQGSSIADLDQASRAFLGTTVYTLPLTLSMLFCTYLSAYALMLEKAKRTLESLLATPASLRQVWLGKSLAVAVPSIVITLIVLVVAVLVLNLVVIVPKTGAFVIPDALPLATGVLLIPVLTFGVVAVVSLLQLTMANPRIANFAFIAVFFGFYMVTVTEVSASWDFSAIYLAAVAFLAGANLLLARLLTKERVVLSSKG
jgi:ABC-2 type transport system permease protein